MWEHHDVFDPRWLASHEFALIDASWRDEVPAAWPTQVVAPAFLGRDTSRCPLLLHVGSLPAVDREGLIDRLAQEAIDRQDTLCSILMASPAPAKQLVDHLAGRMVLRIPGQDQPRQWRYCDPGTFLQLPRMLGPQGTAWLLGPVESVLVPWAGQWTCLHRPTVQAAFRLQAAHLEGLSRIGVVNRALLQHEPLANAAAWIGASAAVDGVVRRAMDQHGLRRQGDLVAFARHALQHHPRHDTHPRVQSLLARLKAATSADEIDYEELSATLSQQDWQAICRELPPADPLTALQEG